jgi:hypothetical protein
MVRIDGDRQERQRLAAWNIGHGKIIRRADDEAGDVRTRAGSAVRHPGQHSLAD